MAISEVAPVLIAPPATFSGYLGAVPARGAQRCWLYLSPTLLGCPRAEVYHTIAHELAHVFRKHPHSLGHGVVPNHVRAENEADYFAEKWGFPEVSSDAGSERA